MTKAKRGPRRQSKFRPSCPRLSPQDAKDLTFLSSSLSRTEETPTDVLGRNSLSLKSQNLLSSYFQITVNEAPRRKSSSHFILILLSFWTNLVERVPLLFFFSFGHKPRVLLNILPPTPPYTCPPTLPPPRVRPSTHSFFLPLTHPFPPGHSSPSIVIDFILLSPPLAVLSASCVSKVTCSEIKSSIRL